jgi:predicted TIM-barrel enzyme
LYSVAQLRHGAIEGTPIKSGGQIDAPVDTQRGAAIVRAFRP